MGARTLAATVMRTNDLQFCKLKKFKKQLRSREGSKLIDRKCEPPPMSRCVIEAFSPSYYSTSYF